MALCQISHVLLRFIERKVEVLHPVNFVSHVLLRLIERKVEVLHPVDFVKC